MYVCTSLVCLEFTEARRRVGSPGTGVTDWCELLCGCWESHPGSLEDQPVSFTTEPSHLQAEPIFPQTSKNLGFFFYPNTSEDQEKKLWDN